MGEELSGNTRSAEVKQYKVSSAATVCAFNAAFLALLSLCGDFTVIP